jgi:hypothetical protein
MSETLEQSANEKPAYAPLVYYTTVRAYPSVADGKATALLGAYGLMLSVLVASSRPLGTIVVGPVLGQALLVWLLLAPCVGLVLIGIAMALRALTRPVPEMPQSLAYYQHLSALPRGEYFAQMEGLGRKESLRHLMTHHHAVSVLSVRKFALVERSVSCLRGAFVLWLLLMLRLALAG